MDYWTACSNGYIKPLSNSQTRTNLDRNTCLLQSGFGSGSRETLDVIVDHVWMSGWCRKMWFVSKVSQSINKGLCLCNH